MKLNGSDFLLLRAELAFGVYRSWGGGRDDGEMDRAYRKSSFLTVDAFLEAGGFERCWACNGLGVGIGKDCGGRCQTCDGCGTRWGKRVGDWGE